MNSSVIILSALSIIFFGIFIILLILDLRSDSKGNENKIEPVIENNTEKIKILLSENAIEKVDNLVDSLIKNAIDKYMIFNVNFDKEKYLNAGDQEQMTLYVTGMVMNNMTDTVRSTIGLVYDISTEQKLKEFLDIRIKMSLLVVIVNQNKDLI